MDAFIWSIRVVLGGVVVFASGYLFGKGLLLSVAQTINKIGENHGKGKE